jgi:hypothetical protein
MSKLPHANLLFSMLLVSRAMAMLPTSLPSTCTKALSNDECVEYGISNCSTGCTVTYNMTLEDSLFSKPISVCDWNPALITTFVCALSEAAIGGVVGGVVGVILLIAAVAFILHSPLCASRKETKQPNAGSTRVSHHSVTLALVEDGNPDASQAETAEYL